METIRLQTKVNADGSLNLQLKDLPVSQKIELLLVYQPISEQDKIVPSHQEPDSLK